MSRDLYESIESMINKYKKLTDVSDSLYPGISEYHEGTAEGRAEVALMAIEDLTSILVEIASEDDELSKVISTITTDSDKVIDEVDLDSSVDKLRDSLSLF